jgi:hypothetical protein
MSNREVYERVVQGYRMKKPKSCPDVIYDLMTSCWEDTSRRPLFREIETVSGGQRGGGVLAVFHGAFS